MSKRQTPASRKLTRAERKQIAAAIERAKRTDKKQLSAQQSIPYHRMYPDGLCRVTDRFYSKTIQYQDINYQLAQNEDQEHHLKSKNPRIHFTDEERASPELKKPIRKANKAADRVDAVRKKARLRFDEDVPKPPSKLIHEVQKAPGKLLSEEVHRNIKSAEDDNVGVEAVHGAEQAAEAALHIGESAYHAGKLKPYSE